MIFIDKMKNFKIYRTSLFLPTLEGDKKHKSAILLMTPNYNSSKKLMTHDLFVNRLRYSSYYVKRDISYYINSKNVSSIQESSEEFINEGKIPYENDKGEKVPEVCPKCGSKVGIFLKGEPIFLCSNKDCEEFFGVVPFNESSCEESISSEDFLKYLPESCLNMGDKVLFFNEDVNDTQLYKMIFKNRMKTRKDVILLYDQVKRDLPFINFTYPEIEKYRNKNLFVDLSFYNKIFFENNTWVLNKGLNLYLTFMSRLLEDPELKANGYIKKTIFIPVLDWCTEPTIWNYKFSLNPMSIIYHMMVSGFDKKLKEVFGNNDIIFYSDTMYFKINFAELEDNNFSKYASNFKLFLIKIIRNEDFDASDVDTSADYTEAPEVIKANIIDKIETSKGIDLTSILFSVRKEKRLADKKDKVSLSVKPKNTKDLGTNKNTENNSESKPVISKLTLNKPVKTSTLKFNNNIKKLARAVDYAGDFSTSEDDALDFLDNEEEIKQILIDLDSKAEDKPDVTAGRLERISELNKKLLDSEVKGKSIKEILEPTEKKDPPKLELDISSPNKEYWSKLTYTKFDTDYDIDKDIIRCFKHFSETSRPISIRNIEVVNNSTSEDRVELYTVEMEDYRGKRFTVKLDIPIMVDNRFLLRGNNKTIQTQFFNMPIIKTDFNTCQIISNYMKIFVRKFGSGAGKSLPLTSRFIKAAKKYTGRNIKFELGDNTKVCNKYELPIDYIDLSGILSKITTSEFIIYFNQDEIRKTYNNIDDSLGVPYVYNIKDKTIGYYGETQNTFTEELFSLFAKYQDFVDIFDSTSSPTVCSYSRCSIMNSQIPLVVICAYHEGLRKTLEKAKIQYKITSTLTKEDRHNPYNDWIKFKDGYVIYNCTYEASMLMNGLKTCATEIFEVADIDNKNMYLEFLDNFGGRIKADGLENFYDLMIDPMTRDSLEFYKMPTDYVSILLYANALLVDNKYIRHTDTSSRRFRRYMLIAVYTYKVLADAYASYSNQLKHNRQAAQFSLKQSAVIDKFLTDTITSDDSCINALRDVEATNAVTTKGPSGMNTDRAYSLDKRGYDESMLNVLGMSTGFAANVGITRQSTIDANVDENGYVISINGDTDKMNTVKSLTITEALTPFGSTHDDPIRTAMTFIQTAKHEVRTEDSDPLLVTNGSDEALAYLTTDKFAFKAKKEGKILELNDDYIILEYSDGSKDYINLKETIEKNSDGGYFVPLKLDMVEDLKVGNKVKANQIIAYDKYSFSNSLGESNNIAYNIGKLAKVAIINTEEGFEDSGIITESMANKLATRIDLKFEVTLDKNTNIISMLKVGDKVECGDSLMIWQDPFDDAEANSLMKTLAGDDVSELGKKKLKSEVTGTITAIKIFRTVELEDLSESLRKVVKEYEKPLVELEKILSKNNIDTSQIPAHYSLPPTGKLKKAQNAIVIEYYVEYLDTVGVGDKVVYFSANKAVEKNLIPLGKEPYTEFRPNEPIDAFVSETSIDKRMVTSTPIYGSLQKLMIELDRSVKDIMGIPYDDSTV